MNSRRVSALSAEAFVFTYPLIVMSLTCRQLTTTGLAGGLHAPVNQFAHLREFPIAPFSPIVTPNRDALYSSAWLDLSARPLVLSLPDFGSRFFTMPMYDAWTQVFTLRGSRTSGGVGAKRLVILGPHSPPIPLCDLPMIQSPTNMVWILGRIQADGPADCAAVHAIQDQLRLMPFRNAGRCRENQSHGTSEARPSVSTPTMQLTRMDAQQYFGMAARLLAANPPQAEDEPVVARMGQLGLVAGRPLSAILADPRAAPDLVRGMKDGLAQIEAAGTNPPTLVRGTWMFPRIPQQGVQDYLVRAGAAWTGLGATPPSEALESITTVDAEGRPLTGEQNYALHFAAGATPPVRAFWSLAVHQPRHFFVDVPGRDSIGDRDALHYNADGSLDMYLQQEDPGGRLTANWLSTPRGTFGLVLRLYWPLPHAVSGTWWPPPVTRRG